MAEGPDIALRKEVFEQVNRLSELHGCLTSQMLRDGVTIDGQRMPIVNPQRGIFKPRRMRYLLSIRTVVPNPGGKIWYEDQRRAHVQIFASRESVEYDFMGTNPDAADNRWLREAYENGIPILYFLGVAPRRYRVLCPTFISGWDPHRCKARVIFGSAGGNTIYDVPELAERRYALQITKRRLHQDIFREAVLEAYEEKCAISGLPEPRLLDAAHIIEDKDEALGQPIVPNGLPLSKIHHAAFDAHLIGIDPDYKLHVSDRLLCKHDGPMLESLKALAGSKLRLPRNERHHPARHRLDIRFEKFKKAA